MVPVGEHLTCQDGGVQNIQLVRDAYSMCSQGNLSSGHVGMVGTQRGSLLPRSCPLRASTKQESLCELPWGSQLADQGLNLAAFESQNPRTVQV